jgi:hypothetical protein
MTLIFNTNGHPVIDPATPLASPAYWRESWQIALWWHAQRPDCTLHSKYPEEAPEGYVRCGYAAKCGDGAQGPNYFYLRPGWITALHPATATTGAAWVTWREPGRRTQMNSQIDPETYALLLPYGTSERPGPRAFDARQLTLF